MQRASETTEGETNIMITVSGNETYTAACQMLSDRVNVDCVEYCFDLDTCTLADKSMLAAVACALDIPAPQDDSEDEFYLALDRVNATLTALFRTCLESAERSMREQYIEQERGAQVTRTPSGELVWTDGWEPVDVDAEYEKLQDIAAQYDTSDPLPIVATTAYHLEVIGASDLTATDLASEIARMADPTGVECYRLWIGDSAQPAQVVYSPPDQRIGIAWGADATWADAIDAESGAAMYVNDPDAFAAAN
ncbi:MAG: hypothetical protein KGH75_00615 [Rhodospirillales bacterium]|nr:hypothetical protein [Rhodospirillales bacterium]